MHDFNHYILFGMTFTVFSIGMAAVIMFRLISTHAPSQQKSIREFMGFFVCASFAFLSFLFIRDDLVGTTQAYKSSLALFFNTMLYTAGVLSLRQGMVVRARPSVRSLFNTPMFYLNIALACIIQHVMFNYFPQHHPLRISIFNAHLILIFLSAVPFVSSKKFGERVVKYTIFVMSASLVLMSIPLFFDTTYKFYNVSVMATQSLNYVVWLSALFILLLADTIDTHYHNSITDAMTGLFNRRHFIDTLNTAVQTNSVNGSSLIICDIDDFKCVNDTHGHNTGDRLIKAFADALSGQLRKEDVLARIGGEEFAVFLPETSKEQAQRIAERMREKVALISIVSDAGNTLSTTASFGVATYLEGNAGSYLSAADRAMYTAKRSGKNNVNSSSLRAIGA